MEPDHQCRRTLPDSRVKWIVIITCILAAGFERWIERWAQAGIRQDRAAQVTPSVILGLFLAGFILL